MVAVQCTSNVSLFSRSYYNCLRIMLTVLPNGNTRYYKPHQIPIDPINFGHKSHNFLTRPGNNLFYFKLQIERLRRLNKKLEENQEATMSNASTAANLTSDFKQVNKTIDT